MSLVADYSSSDSEDSDHQQIVKPQAPPPEKIRITASKPKETWQDILDKEKEKGGQRSAKIKRKGGLSSILPKPKNTNAPQSILENKRPPSPPQLLPPAAADDSRSASDQEDNASGHDPKNETFFTIAQDNDNNTDYKDEGSQNATGQQPTAEKKGDAHDTTTGILNLQYDHNSGYYYDPSSGAYYYYDYGTGQYLPFTNNYDDQARENSGDAASASSNKGSDNSHIDDTMLKNLTSKRERELFGNLVGSNLQSVSQNEQLSDAAQFASMHAASNAIRSKQPAKETYKHLEPSKKQKKSHNIMALAYQAKEMESKLKESYATNRKTKKETQAKYGF